MPNLTDNPGFTNSTSRNTESTNTTNSDDILKSQTEYLKSIDESLKNILKNGAFTSQSAARDSTPRRDEFSNSTYRNAHSSRQSNNVKFNMRGSLSSFTDALEDELVKSLVGSGFSDEIKKSLKDVAKSLGAELEDIPTIFGKEIGKQLGEAIKSKGSSSNNPIIKNINKRVNKAREHFSNMGNAYKSNYESNIQKWNDQNPDKASSLQSLNDRLKYKNEQDAFKSQFISSQTAAINNKYAQAIKMESAQPVNIVGAEISLPVYLQSDSSKLTKAEDLISGEYSKENKDKELNGLSDLAQSTLQGKINEGEFGGELIQESASSIFSSIIDEGGAAQQLSGVFSGLAGAAGEAAAGFIEMAPALLLMKGLDITIGLFKSALAPATEGLKKLGSTVSKTINRTHSSEKKMLEHAQDRLIADVHTLVEEPFNILKDAATELYSAWDNNVRKINQTQGYSKEDLQSLIGSYAQRLRDEGLSSVVSSADITNSLSKVLESGLSGQVAEEFSYLATKLNAAIPTQDFFSYANTYASLAATAIQNGQSQSQAIEYANSQLEAFANNILYASRQISGGFSTGLQNASELFDKSVKIAQSGRSTNVSEISGVMASVSAIVGAVAPDLASSITDLIYQAATGGNTPQLVALRSLAGINASNTEFLREFTQNPQAVLSELFTNLARMQSMSSDNYMEVAEGRSDVFGVSMDAFARVDFNYLAQAISQMNVNSGSLEDNLKLLASGESTTTAEQLRMQQINQYMIDEGLAYVLDNQAARAIQEHMWSEQIANDIMEATYGVELTGAAAEALQGIKQTVENIIGFLIPFIGIGRAISNITSSTAEAKGIKADIKSMLEAGKVGSGNKSDLYNLTTRGQDLNLTHEYVELLGAQSQYAAASASRKSFDSTWYMSNRGLNTFMQNKLRESDSLRSHQGPTSMYDWGMIGKSYASNALGGLSGGSPTGSLLQTVQSASKSAQAQAQSKLDKYISTDYMQGFIDEGKSFNDYFKAANKALGGKLQDQLDDADIKKSDLESQFQSLQTQKGAQEQEQRQQREEDFWKNTQDYLLQTIELFTYQNKVLEDFYKKHSEFYDSWVDYFVKHTAYSAAYNHSDVTKVQLAERSGSQDAVYALAEALTKNTVDLLDPTVQTNAILSQILIVVNAIMQQNNKTGSGLSLPDTLSGLALGIVKQT